MRSFLQKHEVWIFFALIIAVNTAFILGLHYGILPFRLYNLGRFLLLGAVLVAVILASRGVAGLKTVLKPLTHWRVPPGWFVFAALWAVSFCLLFLTAKALVTGEWPDPLMPGLEYILRPSLIRTVVIGALIGEIVWVSYAFAKLAPQFGTLWTALIVGSVWTGWWTPMIVINIGVIADLPILPLWINMVGIALVCGTVYGNTRSGLPVLLLQIGVNSVIIVFPVAPATGGVSVYWAYSVTYLAAALALYAMRPPRWGT